MTEKRRHSKLKWVSWDTFYLVLPTVHVKLTRNHFEGLSLRWCWDWNRKVGGTALRQIILFSIDSDKHLFWTQQHHYEFPSASLRTPYHRQALTCFCDVQASHKWQKAGKCSCQPGRGYVFLPHLVVCLPSFVWGGITRYNCFQLPLTHRCQPPPGHWQAVVVPCLQMSQGWEGDVGVQGEGEVVKQSSMMVALKHTDSPLSAKGIVFHPAWRKEGNWRRTILCSLPIPQQTMARVSCPAVGSSCPPAPWLGVPLWEGDHSPKGWSPCCLWLVCET